MFDILTSIALVIILWSSGFLRGLLIGEYKHEDETTSDFLKDIYKKDETTADFLKDIYKKDETISDFLKDTFKKE